MSLKFAALGTLTILSALGTSTRAGEKGQESLFPDADQGRAEHSENGKSEHSNRCGKHHHARRDDDPGCVSRR